MNAKKSSPFLFVILSAIGLILLGAGLYGYSLSYQLYRALGSSQYGQLAWGLARQMGARQNLSLTESIQLWLIDNHGFVIVVGILMIIFSFAMILLNARREQMIEMSPDSTTWRCPKCGTLNKRGIHICTECGSDAPSRSFFRN